MLAIFFEYKEEEMINKFKQEIEDQENDFSYTDKNGKITEYKKDDREIKLTKKEIDEEFENLNLEDF